MTQEDREYNDIVTKEIQEIIPEYTDKDFESLSLRPTDIAFCYEYVKGFDAVEAYMKVFGGEKKHAVVASRKMLNDENIQKAYNILLDKIWVQAQNVLPLQLLSDLNAVREIDIFDYYDDYGNPRPLGEIPEDKRKLIDGIEMLLDKSGGVHINYKLPDKRKVAGTMLELIKIRSEAKKDETQGAVDPEARSMVKRIFGDPS